MVKPWCTNDISLTESTSSIFFGSGFSSIIFLMSFTSIFSKSGTPSELIISIIFFTAGSTTIIIQFALIRNLKDYLNRDFNFIKNMFISISGSENQWNIVFVYESSESLPARFEFYSPLQNWFGYVHFLRNKFTG